MKALSPPHPLGRVMWGMGVWPGLVFEFFVVWTKPKWKVGCGNDLMDEVLQGFGLVGSAKKRDG